MKPDGISWHEYLRGYARLRWRGPDHERRYHELIGFLQPLYAIGWGDLLDSVGPKQVIAERTQEVARRMGHSPFCFRLQCLTTGRVSRFIPYERHVEFGILTADVTSGGPFPLGKQPIVDRITPIIAKIQGDLVAVRPVWDDPTGGVPWFERYNEYLQSLDWLSLRERVLRRDNYRCTITGKSKKPGDPLQVHHLTYERVGCERLEDLVTVCWSQHEKIHQRRFDDAQAARKE